MNQPYVMYPFPLPYVGYLPVYAWQYLRNNDRRYNPSIDKASPPLHSTVPLFDHGKEPFVVNIHQAAKQNENFRTTLWTGDYFQVTLMQIGVGEDIGLELHDNVDQLLRIEEGQGLVQMGNQKNSLDFVRAVQKNDAIIVPAGTWHNLTNTGNTPLKLYSIYAPPNHPFNTIHQTKADDVEH